MLFLNTRFAALAVFCCIATQPFSSPSSVGVSAAVIARNPAPKTSFETYADHKQRTIEEGVHAQSFLAFPWLSKNGGSQGQRPTSQDGSSSGSWSDSEGLIRDGDRQVRRSLNLAPANPFSNLISAALQRSSSSSSSRGDRSTSHARRHSKTQNKSHKTIVIPNNHGSKYVVGHPHARRAEEPGVAPPPSSPQWVANPPPTTPQDGAETNSTTPATSSSAAPPATSSSATTTPYVDPATGSFSVAAAVDGVPGTIGIMSQDSTNSKKQIASLFLTNMNGTYVLNASDTDKTSMYLVNPSTTSPRTPVASGSPSSSANAAELNALASSDGSIPVKLAIPFSDDEDWCATYDPNPPTAEPLTMEPCFPDNSAAALHKSQTFLYNEDTGVIRPSWFSGQEDGKSDVITPSDIDDSSSTGNAGWDLPPPSSASGSSAYPSASASGFAAADDDAATSSGVFSASASSSAPSSAPSLASRSASLASRQDSSTANAQNVTLVFIPTKKLVANAAVAAAVTGGFTSTVTQTVTSTVYSSSVFPSSSVAASSFGVAEADPTSSDLSSVVFSSSAFPSASGSVSSTSSTPMVTGLGVELVGFSSAASSSGFESGPQSASASASKASESASATLIAQDDSFASASSFYSASASASSYAPKESIDAEGIAASIALSFSRSASASASASSSAAFAAASAGDFDGVSYSVYPSSSGTASGSGSLNAFATESASYASASASGSASASAAAPSSSGGKDDFEGSGPFVAAVMARAAEKTGVSTEPYTWKFKRDV